MKRSTYLEVIQLQLVFSRLLRESLHINSKGGEDDFCNIFGSIASNPEGRDVASEFLLENWNEIDVRYFKTYQII